MKNFYLLGSNIKNSLSPFIHGIIYRETGQKARYLLKETSFLPEIKQLNADGLNITAPFKTQILRQLDQNFSNCASVNTVKIGELTQGYSTDGQGFLLDAERLGLDLSSVLILGTGGAAKSVADKIKKSRLHVWGRNEFKKKLFAKEFNAEIFNKTAEIKLVINCTGAFLPEFNDLKAPVYDLNYVNPQGISGIGMLIYQAILSDEIFFGTKIDLEIFSTILKELKELKELRLKNLIN